MVYCAVVRCSSRTQTKAVKLKTNEKDCAFFKIPKVRSRECEKTKELCKRRRREWIARINRRGIDENPDKYWVCSRDFLSGRPSDLFDDCNPDWAPSQCLGYGNILANNERYNRQNSRAQRRSFAPGATDASKGGDSPAHEIDAGATSGISMDMESSPHTNEAEPDKSWEPRIDTACQTDMTITDVAELEEKLSTCQRQLDECQGVLRSQTFTEDSLQGNGKKVAFYTGLPTFVVLLRVFDLLKDHISYSGKHSLTQFQEMVLFLMRMRLGCPFQDLAYRFDIAQSTASRIFDRWLDVCFDRLGLLVRWPEKEEIMKTMPMAFVENFGLKVRVILDCFEVFIDRPSSYLPRAETWSAYKHNNTVKFLLGICPQGSVTFLSQAFGGRASDKAITEECGVLNLLEYGDVVLADRGFLIAESVGLCHASLVTPAFTKGKRQLSSSDIERTREIANVRIHVERVIGMVRNKFTVLKGSLPIEALKANEHGECQIDKIARVCCALTNLCNSVVSFD
ncbi:uncharacterized protein [Dermacentor albipictus]|uniref:uncharacterized protein n=1 Tax=Dermacentor albipictus TaxID=60249 RepID=UPI0038FC4EA7